MPNEVVLLVFGDVNGQFRMLFRKLNKLVPKLGNVAMAICVGNFFGLNRDEEWEEVLCGKLKAPTQIFILGPASNNVRRFYTDCFIMTDLAERITFLGKSGTFRIAEGVKLAYVSGLFDETNSSELTYSFKDINKLVKDSMFGRPDLLLTCSWPHDFGNLVEMKHKSNTTEMASTFLFSFLAPQYHLAARERESVEVAVERFYDNKTSAGISRFVGLSFLGEETGFKWIKALKVTPYSVKSADHNPLNIIPLTIPGVKEISQRTETNIYSEQHRNCNSATCVEFAIARSGTVRKMEDRERFQKREELPCWFCFSSPDFEKHMVIAIGEYTFLTIAKGPVIDDHLLISTIYHLPSMRVVKKEVRDEIELFKKAIRYAYGTSFFPVFYERSFKSNHLQIQCVPIPVEKYDCIVPAFKKLAEDCDLMMTESTYKMMSFMSLDEKEKYFHVDLSGGHELLISGDATSYFPINFGREALVKDSLLNMPEKKDWKNCKQSKEYEIELVRKFKRKFQKYDFT